MWSHYTVSYDAGSSFEWIKTIFPLYLKSSMNLNTHCLELLEGDRRNEHIFVVINVIPWKWWRIDGQSICIYCIHQFSASVSCPTHGRATRLASASTSGSRVPLTPVSVPMHAHSELNTSNACNRLWTIIFFSSNRLQPYCSSKFVHTITVDFECFSIAKSFVIMMRN